MLEHLRGDDRLLFEQLEQIAGRLARAAELLEQLLGASDASAVATNARELRELDASARTTPEGVDVHNVPAFAKRLDRLEYRELATALDAALESVRGAAAHAASLRASDAPEALRGLAHALTGAASALHEAVPFVGESAREVHAHTTEIRRWSRDGEAYFYRGVEALFANARDATEVMRWKEIYDVVWNALERCVTTTDVLERLTGVNV